MSNFLMNRNNNQNSALLPYEPSSYSGVDILSAIPLALAAPLLAYQKTKAQKELMAVLIEARRQERSEVLKTMQVLASHGQLTAELSQQLMVAYYQQPY